MPVARFRDDGLPVGVDWLASSAKLHHSRSRVIAVQVAHGLECRQAELVQGFPDAVALRLGAGAGEHATDGRKGVPFGAGCVQAHNFTPIWRMAASAESRSEQCRTWPHLLRM